MRYWLITLTEDSFFICMRLGILGAKERRGAQFSKFEPGDRIVFYVSRKYASRQTPKISEFRGTGRVTGRSFFETTKLWNSIENEIYPVRIRFRPDISKGGVQGRDIIKSLDFIGEQEFWYLAFFNTPRELSQKDFMHIEHALREVDA